MNKKFCCAIYSKGLTVMDEVLAANPRAAASRFLSDELGKLAAGRIAMGNMVLERISDDPAAEWAFVCGPCKSPASSEATWFFKVVAADVPLRTNVVVRHTKNGEVLLEADNPVDLYFLEDGDSNWCDESSPDSCVSLDDRDLYVRRMMCEATDITDLLEALDHVPSSN